MIAFASAAVCMKSVSLGAKRFEAKIDALPFQFWKCRRRRIERVILGQRPRRSGGNSPLHRRAKHEKSRPKIAATPGQLGKVQVWSVCGRRRSAEVIMNPSVFASNQCEPDDRQAPAIPPDRRISLRRKEADRSVIERSKRERRHFQSDVAGGCNGCANPLVRPILIRLVADGVAEAHGRVTLRRLSLQSRHRFDDVQRYGVFPSRFPVKVGRRRNGLVIDRQPRSARAILQFA